MTNSNPDQRRAITHGVGPLLIIAGPGSGKTYTLTGRIKYIINDLKADPSSVLVLTFSRAAAEEMENRYYRIDGKADRGQITFGTFHSVFYHLLLTAYGNAARRYIFAEGGGCESSEDDVKFREMLQLTYELLRSREDIRESLKNRYKWILIDEFQDIDELQYSIIMLIADKNANLTVVGDDDQSIYGFRGARPDIMLGFKKDYPKAKRITLKTNYRSTPQIVKASSRLIRHNRKRYRKRIRAAVKSGEKIDVREYETTVDEYRDIIREIAESGETREDSAAYTDCVILFRTNILNEYLTAAIIEAGMNPESISRMTFHESKGLEFDCVYIIDAVEGITPHRRSKSRDEIEEERRMFYVAMTRARKKLVISYVKRSRQRACKMSRFVAELM